MINRIWLRFRDFLWRGYYHASKTNCHRNDENPVRSKRMSDPLYLEQYGYKVYSQNDEDGIINEIFKRIGTTNKVFVEFGVQDGLESNCHFLLHKKWSGLWIEGSKKYYNSIKKLFSEPINSKRLSLINAFIHRDNINEIISSVYTGQIDLLSIDIDGNDYWVWQAINCIQPRVVVIEYNAKFPPDHLWIMKYSKDHTWKNDDNHGASLKALELLGGELGYQLVGTSSTGVNAFFVKSDIASDKFVLQATAENLYNPATYFRVLYKSGHKSIKFIDEG